MNWDANLAAIIKHTDANLQQQFRQFEDLSVDLGGFPQSTSAQGSSGLDYSSFARGGSLPQRQQQQAARPQDDEASGGFANAFLRDTMATMRSAAPATTFAQHFRERQDRKKHHEQHENNRPPSDDGASDYDDASDYQQPQQQPQQQQRPPNHTRRSRHNSNNGHGMGYHMYSSPTYDMAQMMEQVRLSLKLEVDARAAIAERQLSALLQLCKSSSEELDRLRIEVCAADRQLHTLDQVQAKIRQELTTQKDIGFHLQSMCGKDESWRMQAENQLLEMRQMVAALREHGNSIQLQVQEKLSRQELIVQFNAAIEPIKAQFQATLQHQAHQLADVTRTTSSSSLLLDALTQKVNRVQLDEIVALRNDLQALKIHVSKMNVLVDGRVGTMDGQDDDQEEDDEGGGNDRAERGRQPPVRRQRRPTEKEAARERERRENDYELKRSKRDELFKKEICDLLLPQLVPPLVRNEVEKSVGPRIAELKEFVVHEVTPIKQDAQAMARQLQEYWNIHQRQAASTASSVEVQIKQLEQQLRGEVATLARELRDKQEQLNTHSTSQWTTLLDTRLSAVHSKHNDVVKVMEAEQIERKLAMEALQADLRKARHSLEEQLHLVQNDQRNKAMTMSEEWSQKLRDVERKWTEISDGINKQTMQQVDGMGVKMGGRLESVETDAKAMKEGWSKLERAVLVVQEEVARISTKVKSFEPLDDDNGGDGVKPAAVRRASVTSLGNGEANQSTQQLASIDSILQKMMLQMQLQMQQQQQQQAQFAIAQAAAAAAAVSGGGGGHNGSTLHPSYWPQAATYSSVPVVTTSDSTPVAPSVPTETVKEIQAAVALADSSSVVPTAETVSASVSIDSARSPPVQPGGSVITVTAVKAPVQVEMIPDPRIDEIISRAVTEELGVAVRTTSAATPKPTIPPDAIEDKKAGKSSRKVEIIAPSQVTAVPSSTNVAHSPLEAKVDLRESVTSTPQTLLTTTSKGAVTEAEMARLRIEARRKQDAETRVQQGLAMPPASPLKPPSVATPLIPPPLARAASTSSLTPSGPPATGSSGSVIVVAGGQAPSPLTRSSSVTNLMSSPLAPPAATVPRPPSISIPNAMAAPPTTPSKLPPPPPAPPAPPLTGVAPSTPTTANGETKPASVKPRPPPPLTSLASPTTTTTAPPPLTHVLCEQCRLPVRSDLLTEHMTRQCIKRTVGCTKCQRKFPWHEVDAHQRDCPGGSTGGSPNSSPPPVNATTPPVSMSVHVPVPVAAVASASPPSPSAELSDATTASASPTPLLLKKCRHCTADVASNDLFEHELRCDQMLKQCPHCLRRQKVAELQDHIENCDCRLVSCPNDCGGKFLQRGIDKHLTTRCPKRSSTVASSSPAPPATSSLSMATTNSNGASVTGPTSSPPPPLPSVSSTTTGTAAIDLLEKVECKFCDEEFTSPEIDKHEDSCDWKPKRCQHCSMVIISRDLGRHESSCKTSTKNCPHCQDTMPQSAVQLHASRCSKRPIKCIRCCHMFPADSIVAHSSNCKFIPTASSSSPSIASASHAAPPAKIPPPPPYPPTPVIAASSRLSSSSPSTTPGQSVSLPTASAGQSVVASGDSASSVAERLARRNLALSQLTNAPPAATVAASSTAAIGSATSSRNEVVATGSLPRPPVYMQQPQVDDDDDHIIDDEDNEDEDEDGDEDEDEEEDEEDEDDQMTLAQVVAEWSVENVCLWLHEDVGVPEVVPRFQQRRCNGEMLLELTESDLINDYGIKNRVHRERILSAIDAIKTSDDFSDDEEEGDEDEEEEDEEEEEEEEQEPAGVGVQLPQQRASMSRLTLSDVPIPRDPLRRNSLPSPQQSPGRLPGGALPPTASLPSSSAMLRRINTALNVEFPATTSRINK